MARGKKKTKKRASCPSGRAFASGKKKGRCVPKKVRARKGQRHGCYAKTRNIAIDKMQLFNKRAVERESKKAAASQAEAAAAVRAEEGAEFTAHEYNGLGRVGRRRRRHHR